jgi:hypothetical protein
MRTRPTSSLRCSMTPHPPFAAEHPSGFSLPQQLSRARFLATVDTPPFSAALVRPTGVELTATGLCIAADGRVLHRHGHPIARLHATERVHRRLRGTGLRRKWQLAWELHHFRANRQSLHERDDQSRSTTTSVLPSGSRVQNIGGTTNNWVIRSSTSAPRAADPRGPRGRRPSPTERRSDPGLALDCSRDASIRVANQPLSAGLRRPQSHGCLRCNRRHLDPAPAVISHGHPRSRDLVNREPRLVAH